LDCSPLVPRNLKRKRNYAAEKTEQVAKKFRRSLELGEPVEQEEETEITEDQGNKEKTLYFDEMISGLKLAYENGNREEQFRVLTSLPLSWGIRKIMKEFNIGYKRANLAKKLQRENGFQTCPEKRFGKSLSEEIVKKIKEFYQSDDISRMLPGKKDCVSMKVEGIKQRVQKRLILCSLKECFICYQEKYRDDKVGFSKFCELRPKNVVLPGAAGTHNVCVCTYHQNVKLMIEAAGLNKENPFSFDGPDITYKNYITLLLCSNPTNSCYLNECSSCKDKDLSDSQEVLLEMFYKEDIQEISFCQWESTDRSTLVTKILAADEFVEFFFKELQRLKPHMFVAKKQSEYFQFIKNNLEEGHVVIGGDFSENYSFIVQDSAQAFHWNKDAATIHPFIVYYKSDRQVKSLSVAMISDELIHDTTAVYVFQTKLLDHLRNTLDFAITRVIYFSDGCVAQYKNYKNLTNLCHHHIDFGIHAEWHFFATSHGKGAYDGIGGTIKREAAYHSLKQTSSNQILNAEKLFDFAKSHLKNITVFYFSKNDIKKKVQFLKKRFAQSTTIVGTRSFHSFVPFEENKMYCRKFSLSEEKFVRSIV